MLRPPYQHTYRHQNRKNAAQKRHDLIKIMSIPQVRVNPINENVTDNFGSDVTVYINYLQASKEELTGLRTADVRKVEYLEFPTDPPFSRTAKSNQYHNP